MGLVVHKKVTLSIGLLALARAAPLPHFRHPVDRPSCQNLGDERRPNDCRAAMAAAGGHRRPADRKSGALDRDRATFLLARNLKTSVHWGLQSG